MLILMPGTETAEKYVQLPVVVVATRLLWEQLLLGGDVTEYIHRRQLAGYRGSFAQLHRITISSTRESLYNQSKGPVEKTGHARAHDWR